MKSISRTYQLFKTSDAGIGPTVQLLIIVFESCVPEVFFPGWNCMRAPDNTSHSGCHTEQEELKETLKHPPPVHNGLWQISLSLSLSLLLLRVGGLVYWLGLYVHFLIWKKSYNFPKHSKEPRLPGLSPPLPPPSCLSVLTGGCYCKGCWRRAHWHSQHSFVMCS